MVKRKSPPLLDSQTFCATKSDYGFKILNIELTVGKSYQSFDLRLFRAHMAPPLKLKITCRLSHTAAHLIARLNGISRHSGTPPPALVSLHQSSFISIMFSPVATTTRQCLQHEKTNCSADIHNVGAPNESTQFCLSTSQVNSNNPIDHISVFLRTSKDIHRYIGHSL